MIYDINRLKKSIFIIDQLGYHRFQNQLLYNRLIVNTKLHLCDQIHKTFSTSLSKAIKTNKMGRNKHRGKGKSHHNNNNNNNTQSNNNYPKASEQQLQVQCLQLYQLLTNKSKILKQQKLDYCYIISTRWLEDWKDYVGFYNLSENDEKKHKKIGKKNPGKINHDLVADNKGFYNVPLDDYDYLNTVINQKKEQDDDFIAIAKQIWDIFASKYDHIAIKRPKHVTKKGSVIYDGTMLQLQVVIVNYNDDNLIESIKNAKVMPKRDLDTEFPCDKMQLATLWDILELYNFLEDYAYAEYQEKQVTIWKIDGYSSIGAVQRALWEGINKKNSKISVPCRELNDQNYKGLDLDQFLKTYHSLVLEVGKSKIKRAQIANDLQGYCQQCVKKKPLRYRCLCNNMFYCSQQCRVIDQVWHEKACSLAFDSQDDEEYTKKNINLQQQLLPTCGLNNLGNTCYMNSVLQSLVCVKEISTYFTQNNWAQCIDPKEFQENKGRLLFKYSKFLKNLTETKQSLAPWSLKGQINYFMPPFKGFKQHDANDFLINFTNCLNDQLKKEQGKPFHSIFDTFLGEFNSLIRCPDCNIEISNDEIFTQLTLPIKQKAKVQTTNYIIYESPQKVVTGKCYVESSWEQIRKSLGLSEVCLLMAGREGEHIIDLDEDELVEKAIKKIKRDLIFYPNCKYNEEDQFFSFITISEKLIYGSRMKSPYGYPAVININPILHTLGSFWVQILKHFCPKQIYEKSIEIRQKYFQQTQQIVVMTNQKQQQSQKTENTNSKEQLQKKLTQEIQQKCNNELKELLNKHKIQVFINDTKKSRNICSFCKKKCTGCDLPIEFSTELKDFLEGKLRQVQFEIILEQKIEVQKVQKDIARSGQATLHDCMQLLTEPEQLDEQNAWWCQQCQNLRLAFKQLTIKKLPHNLIIHLNRFKTQNDKKVKNSQPIEYQEFEQFCGKKYQLLSVIVHEGSIEGGHYWAICRRNDKYYIFNDSKVSVTEKICNKNAYILIYTAV